MVLLHIGHGFLPESFLMLLPITVLCVIAVYRMAPVAMSAVRQRARVPRSRREIL